MYWNKPKKETKKPGMPDKVNFAGIPGKNGTLSS